MDGFEALAVTQLMPSRIVEARSESTQPRTFAGYGPPPTTSRTSFSSATVPATWVPYPLQS
jgi:hypothetical protein